jgi:ribonuclease HI
MRGVRASENRQPDRGKGLAKKFYVVWAGRQTGVFTDWDTARQQVDKFAAARYKSFPTRAEAEQAFRAGSPRSSGSRVFAKKAAISAPAATDHETFDLQIYCDGACEPNPGNAGSGIAVYRDGVPVQLWYGLYNPHGTNNTAELNALYHALLMAEQAILAGETPQVLSDSMYAINCITTWAAGWEKKGWRKAGGEIKNLEIIQTTYALYNRIKPDMQLIHISAHVGTEGNELADRMAMLAVQSKQVELRLYAEEIDIPTILRMRAG